MTAEPAAKPRRKKTLDEQIEGCPKAVQEHIDELKRQAEEAQGEAEEALDASNSRLDLAALWEMIGDRRSADGETDAALRAYRAADNIRWTEDVLWSDGVPA